MWWKNLIISVTSSIWSNLRFSITDKDIWFIDVILGFCSCSSFCLIFVFKGNPGGFRSVMKVFWGIPGFRKGIPGLFLVLQTLIVLLSLAVYPILYYNVKPCGSNKSNLVNKLNQVFVETTLSFLLHCNGANNQHI